MSSEQLSPEAWAAQLLGLPAPNVREQPRTPTKAAATTTPAPAAPHTQAEAEPKAQPQADAQPQQLDLAKALDVAGGAEPQAEKPKRKRAKGKPKAPVVPPVPNPFADLPAPALPPIERITTAERLAEVIDGWLLRRPEFVVLDVETTGLHTWLGHRTRLVQLLASDEETALLIDTWATPGWAEALQPLLLQQHTRLVGHYFLFDVQMLLADGLRWRCPIGCTWHAGRLLCCNELPIQQRISERGSGLDLASCAGRVLRVHVDKGLQTGGDRGWGNCPEPGVPFSGIDAAMDAYAALDVALTKDIWIRYAAKLRERGFWAAAEAHWGCLPGVASCRHYGVPLDLDGLNQLVAKSDADLEGLLERIQTELELENPGSSLQLADALQRRGHELTERTATGQLSTSKKVVDPILTKDQGLAPLKEYRDLGKRLSTWLRNWQKLVELSGDGRVHPLLDPFGTETGRMSCKADAESKVPASAMHQVPGALRHLFVAPEGWVMVGGDLKAIEPRLQVHIYGETAFKDQIENNKDSHTCIAASVYGIPYEEITPEMRTACKPIGLGQGYGQSVYGLRFALEARWGRPVTEAEAQAAFDAWCAVYTKLWEKRQQIARDRPWAVHTLLGWEMHTGTPAKGVPGKTHSRFQRRRYENVSASRSDNGKAWRAANSALSNPIQATAAEVFKMIVARVHPQIEDLGGHIWMLFHDEIQVLVPEAAGEAAAAILRAEMSAPDLQKLFLDDQVPLVGDVKIGRRWSETK